MIEPVRPQRRGGKVAMTPTKIAIWDFCKLADLAAG